MIRIRNHENIAPLIQRFITFAAGLFLLTAVGVYLIYFAPFLRESFVQTRFDAIQPGWPGGRVEHMLGQPDHVAEAEYMDPRGIAGLAVPTGSETIVYWDLFVSYQILIGPDGKVLSKFRFRDY